MRFLLLGFAFVQCAIGTFSSHFLRLVFCWCLFGFAWMRTAILAGGIAVVRSGWVLVFLFATEDRVVVNVFIVHWRLDYQVEQRLEQKKHV